MTPPTESPLLTDAEVATLVDKGLALHAAIETNKTRLKAISDQLQAHALSVPSQHVKLVDEDREGTRFLAIGTEGKAVSIVCTSDLIIQTLTEDSPTFSTLYDLAGDLLPLFFAPTRKWEIKIKDGKDFRQDVRASLPDPEAFISACTRRNKDGIPVSAIKVEWL